MSIRTYFGSSDIMDIYHYFFDFQKQYRTQEIFIILAF